VELRNPNWIGATRQWAWRVMFDERWAEPAMWREKLTPLMQAIEVTEERLEAR
jgi:hypothetical protein